MMSIVKCMCIDSYFCLLVFGQVISWIGIGTAMLYVINRFIFEKDEYES